MDHDQDDEFESATANYQEEVKATRVEFADTIKMLEDAIYRATEDERAEIQDALDDKHSDLKDNLPNDLDFDEHEEAWSQWVTDEIANRPFATQLASAIAGDGVDEIRDLVLTRIAANRVPTP